MLKEYDPNVRWLTHTLEVTLMEWDFKAVLTVKSGGNVKGMNTIESVHSTILDSKISLDLNKDVLIDHGEYVEIILSNGTDELSVDIHDEEELKNYIVKVEIVSYVDDK